MNRRKLILTTSLALFAAVTLSAQQQDESLEQENARKIAELQQTVNHIANGVKLSGYIQTQWQWTPVAEAPPESFISTYGSAFTENMKNRFMVRRGRIKFTIQQGPVTVVAQPDFTEGNIKMKDLYVGYTALNKTVSLRLGLFDRPFGYDLDYSSVYRETAERSRTLNSIMADARDVGFKVQLTGWKGFLSHFTLDAGMFSGNGAAFETDSFKDFIARLMWDRKFGTTQLGAALSLYEGTIYGGTLTDKAHDSYSYVEGAGWQQSLSTSTERRSYRGVAAKVQQSWAIGTTKLTGEFVAGEQPSAQNRFNNAIGSNFNGLESLYLRHFRGGYITLVQNILDTKHRLLLKYDRLDPNIRVKGDQIGASLSEYSPATPSDLAYTTWSVGYMFDYNENLRLLAQYDMTDNEKSANLAGFTQNDQIHQNVLTLRVQVRF